MFTISHDQQILQYPSIPLMMERNWKPHVETAPNCPRCASTNTKFCYYNNYSFSQPRYFCKACRRYWTKGGSLRNVPVGRGCRKSRRCNKSVRPPPSPPPVSQDRTSEESMSPMVQSDIDLALVFSNFLNQNLDSVSDSSQQVADLSQIPIEHELMIEGSEPSDLVMDDQVQHGVSMVSAEDLNEVNGLFLEGFLSDPVVEGASLWADDDANTTLPSFTWEPFDQTLSCGDNDDRMNYVWSSSFDLPSFELFSRP